MDTETASVGGLNASHQRYLLTSFEHADALVAEIEAVLAGSTSPSPFPKYQQDLSPAQVKVVQDYLARLRAQMVRVLNSQGITPHGPRVRARDAVRVTLGFGRYRV